jgi:hypothetical protein
MGDTAAAEPTLIRIQHDGWLAFLWIRDQHIRAAHLNAFQACSAKISVK